MVDPALMERARELAARESGLAVVVVQRSDGGPSVSVVNAGVVTHPVSNHLVVAFVARGNAKKLVRLRQRSFLTVVFRSGWDWIAIEGSAELAGPEDDQPDWPVTFESLRRHIYAAAVGGTADQWAPLDESMTAEGHTAVVVTPHRVYLPAPHQ